MSDPEILWHDVVTHTRDGFLSKESYGPGQIMPGTESFIDLLPGETVTIRRVRPQIYLEPGFYWVRSPDYIKGVIMNWNGSTWRYNGAPFDDVEVMSDRLIPPTIVD